MLPRLVVEPALSWLHGLRRTDRDTLIQVGQAVTALQGEGSALPNLKELRPGSAGATEVRLLFVFDPDRQAVSWEDLAEDFSFTDAEKDGSWPPASTGSPSCGSGSTPPRLAYREGATGAQ
ncbi:hypothetical protein [Streptomyces acidiscabies]|uniref:hypothetical protein n=1 Tax=Streptomyces acidiscabies TaxID=42234 RepID=UPI0038F749C4